MSTLKSESTNVTQSNESQLAARDQLWQLFQSPLMPDAEKERNLGLFIRSASLARVLAIDDIYRRIVPLPGAIADFGTWRGQNAVLCENLRAIHEPFNKSRRVLAFDTFSGYASGVGGNESSRPEYQDGCYSTGADYEHALRRILELHESINVLGNVSAHHEVVAGDVKHSLRSRLDANANLVFALAFFDMNLKEPTDHAVALILPRMVSGGILAFFQLERDFLPGEGQVYRERILGKVPHRMSKSRFYPTLSVVELV